MQTLWPVGRMRVKPAARFLVLVSVVVVALVVVAAALLIRTSSSFGCAWASALRPAWPARPTGGAQGELQRCRDGWSREPGRRVQRGRRRAPGLCLSRELGDGDRRGIVREWHFLPVAGCSRLQPVQPG